MPKTVAVMNGLDQVANALAENGIHVVDVADVDAPISAIVYSAKVDPHQPHHSQVTDHVTVGGGVDDLILMLNADDLSTEEILARVKSMW